MNKSYKIEGVVIKRKNFSEADKILTLLTKYSGKITVLAKGIRRINSRRVAHLELFNEIVGFVHRGKSLDILTEATVINTFPNLKKNLKLTALAYRLAEEVDRLCPERQEVRVIYNLFVETLKMYNQQNRDYLWVSDNFSLQLLWELGYLGKDIFLTGENLENFMEKVMEKNHKSNSLLMKV